MKARIVYKTENSGYVLETESSRIKTAYHNSKMILIIESHITKRSTTEYEIPMENIISIDIIQEEKNE